MQLLDLAQWWNLIFDLPFLAGLLPLLLQATGVMHLGHAGHGIHVEHGAHLGGGHHVHIPQLGHHGHVGSHTQVSHAEHGHELTHHAHDSQGPGVMGRMLGLLGIGKVPLMMVLSSLFLIWGFTGIMANLMFGSVIPLPGVYVWFSAGSAFVTSSTLTGLMSQAFSRLMPSVETYVTTEEDLVGRVGKALYTITPNSGAAMVLDSQSNRIQVKCRTEQETICGSEKVSLLQYEEASRTFIVRLSVPALENINSEQQ